MELVPQHEDISPAPLWERRTHETAFEYAWFVRYAELGELRTHAKTSKLLGISVAVIRDAARKNSWDERCAAYDAQVVSITEAISPDESEALHTQYLAGKMLLQMGFDALKSKNPMMFRMKDIRESFIMGSEMMRRGAGIADLKIDHNVVERVAQDLELLLGPERGELPPVEPDA